MMIRSRSVMARQQFAAPYREWRRIQELERGLLGLEPARQDIVKQWISNAR